MANKKVSDKDYLFISSMLKARENRMLRRDRLEQMLSSGSFEEAARLLAEIGWPDLSGKGSAAVSEALAKRQAEIYAEITRFVPEKELVGIFRLKYDYHNAKTIVKGEGAGVDAAYLLSDAGQVEPEKLEAAFREDSFQFIPGKLGPAMAEAKGILARTGNPQLADFALDKAYYEDLKALANAVSSPFVKGYVTTLIDSANLRAACAWARTRSSSAARLSRAAMFRCSGSCRQCSPARGSPRRSLRRRSAMPPRSARPRSRAAR